LDGGTGSDSLTIVNTGAANYTAATAKVKGIETINVTTQNASSSGSAEVATVTVGALQNGQYITIAGQTVQATADLTAAQVATVLTGGSVTGGTLSGTLTSGWTKAAGTNSDVVTYTATTVGNKADLAVGGNSGVNSVQTSIITAGGTVVATDVTTFTFNGVTVVTAAHGATTAASVATALANAINGYAGKNIATAAGADVQVISSTPVSLAGFDATGATATTYAIKNAAGTQTIAVTAGAASATATISMTVNGETVTTGAVGADATTAAAAIVAALNTWAGQTIASNVTNTVTVDGGKYPIAISNLVASAGTYSYARADTVAAAGVSGADATTITDVDGVAAVSAQAYSTTVDASKFTGATTMASVNSTADVSFTNMVSTQAGVVSGNTAITNGNTTFGHKATATSFDIDIKDGTTAGNITATGAAATSANISSSGEKNTVGTIDVAAAKTITVDAATALTATAIATTATAGTLTVNGAGAVSIGTLDAGLDTVNAAGNSGGLTAVIGSETDTVLTGSSGNDKITASTANNIATSAKLAVNAGGGEDTLVVGDANDINTAGDGARYTGFEVLSISDTQDVSLVSGIQKITMAGADSKTISGLSATQASNITVTGNQTTAFAVALTNSTGTSDSATLDLKSATATANVDITALTINGFETLNVIGSTGTAGTDSDITIAAADKLTAVNLSGTADMTFSGDNTVKGVALTSTSSGDITVTGAFVKGSAITTGAGKDIITTTGAVTGTAGEYVSYSTGAGKDQITTTLAALHNTNSTKASLKIDGGADTDTMIMGATDATFTDVSFEHVKGIEVIQFEEEDADLSFTSGSNINANFAEKITLDFDTGMASGVDADIAVTADLGAYTGAATVKITSASAGTTLGDNLSVTTGSGADTVTITAASFTGGANKSIIVVSTGDGADTITVSTGTLATTTTKSAITAGKGADTIDVTTHANGTSETAALTFVIAAGDSEASGYDKITGFDLGVNAGAWSDNLDLASANVSANTAGTNGTDSGSIKSHAITSGIITFDDADLFATALVIGKSDVSNVLTYLNNNITGTDTVAFAYDSSGNGTADSTILFQQGATYDTVVELVDVVGLAVSATAGATAGLIHIM
jgi:hypothetical protein